ncbi:MULTISPECIES: ATP-dependent Clp protease proteolytic subunit [unclassified Pseudomonas]|uniref:ATP-dependent Clp protease proteolytic subunit n=1 Tax=unclassified Pseudomonas TaxID=196821 RepID=UPI001294EDE1|nr:MULTISPECIES: ATP-dependent Clp protease proteolytic subunit [unclassified Pseudomonas]MQT42982.1 ATP-dependent Clp protease proteolytic subunit [Pseudomonas sp. FSL R10-0765]MQT53703.1 ATP-dependent Clp protease proteolytic subunit [Pseudomonas sp. FSL R10-2398]MQU03080.1 ATP-dependent Clp protease proteolytic subunit [Pseudomonas sp. FSL R10-2245]MQU11698.1 ATP-dependent Clp protease proteolytic subunit [Pseudomonas sp. FSL R10-2189]MQU37471.1 ATP-dependent Clp protease proteolytic subuni
MPHLSEKKDRESGGMDSLSSKLLDSTIAARKIFITGEINTKMAKDAVQQLHALAYMSDEPIIVFISSPGGHVESGDMIFDAIRFIKPVVITIGSGWVASAGALIYVAADKENRYSLPNTRFLLHQPSGGFQGKAMDFEAYAKEIIEMKERLNRIFSDATGQPIEKVRIDTDKDFWLSAEEAVEYGLVHSIVVKENEINK